MPFQKAFTDERGMTAPEAYHRVSGCRFERNGGAIQVTTYVSAATASGDDDESGINMRRLRVVAHRFTDADAEQLLTPVVGAPSRKAGLTTRCYQWLRQNVAEYADAVDV